MPDAMQNRDILSLAVVEDNPDVLDDLLFNLRRQGFEVAGYPDGAALDAALAQGHDWTVLVLDLGLPGEDGLSIAHRLRQTHPALGIIALTARGRLQDRVEGLNTGIDLYLVKPIDISELAAAIHAVARRVNQLRVHVPIWRLEPDGYRLVRPDGETITLTVTEFRILHVLACAHAEPVHRDELIRAIGRKPDAYDPRALEVTVSRLRGKLGHQSPLRAVRNQGYRFVADLRVVGDGS